MKCHPVSESEVKDRYEEMSRGPNKQPCIVCRRVVKAEYSFCWYCGQVVCGSCQHVRPTEPELDAPLE